jgi:hypothetical protein
MIRFKALMLKNLKLTGYEVSEAVLNTTKKLSYLGNKYGWAICGLHNKINHT